MTQFAFAGIANCLQIKQFPWTSTSAGESLQCTQQRVEVMAAIVTGIVTNGVVVPNTPLPEGARVNIELQANCPAVPAELQEEFDAWERAGAGTIEMVERLAEDANEKR